MREPKVRNDITSKKNEIEGLEPDRKGSGDSARLKSSLLRNKMTMKLKNKPVTKPQPLTGEGKHEPLTNSLYLFSSSFVKAWPAELQLWQRES